MYVLYNAYNTEVPEASNLDLRPSLLNKKRHKMDLIIFHSSIFYRRQIAISFSHCLVIDETFKKNSSLFGSKCTFDLMLNR